MVRAQMRTGCMVPSAANFDPLAHVHTGGCVPRLAGCMDSAALNFSSMATENDPSLCAYEGCTDPTALNYDPSATLNDGRCELHANAREPLLQLAGTSGRAPAQARRARRLSEGGRNMTAVLLALCLLVPKPCRFTTLIIGCTNSSDANYNPDATLNDGSCYVQGCTDPLAPNFIGTVEEVEPGSCEPHVLGCLDPMASNYWALATESNSSCTYTTYGCTDPAAANYFSHAVIDDASCVYIGCKNNTALNFDPSATLGDASCDFGTPGCMDSSAENYDPTATLDDGSCQTIRGCIHSIALNYNPNATAGEENEDLCIYPVQGCMDSSAANYEVTANVEGECIFVGCTNSLAPNFWPAATYDDGSCEDPIPGCMDTRADNYESFATIDDGSCIIFGCKDPVASNYVAEAMFHAPCSYFPPSAPPPPTYPPAVPENEPQRPPPPQFASPPSFPPAVPETHPQRPPPPTPPSSPAPPSYPPAVPEDQPQRPPPPPALPPPSPPSYPPAVPETDPQRPPPPTPPSSPPPPSYPPAVPEDEPQRPPPPLSPSLPRPLAHPPAVPENEPQWPPPSPSPGSPAFPRQPSPPPPSTPRPLNPQPTSPPAPPLSPLIFGVRVVAIIPGDIGDFDQAAFTNEISDAVSVPSNQIFLQVEAASIRVTTEVFVESPQRQRDVLDILLAFFAAFNSGDTLFGVVISILFEPVAFGLFPPPPSPPPNTVAITTNAGTADVVVIVSTTVPVVVLLMLIILLICLYRHYKRRKRKPSQRSQDDVDHPIPQANPGRGGRGRPSFRKPNIERVPLSRASEGLDESTISFVSAPKPKPPDDLDRPLRRDGSRASRQTEYLPDSQPDTLHPPFSQKEASDLLDASTLLNVAEALPAPSNGSVRDFGAEDSIRPSAIVAEELPNPFMADENSAKPPPQRASMIIPPGVPPSLLRARRAAAMEASAESGSSGCWESQGPPPREALETPQSIAHAWLAASAPDTQPLARQSTNIDRPPSSTVPEALPTGEIQPESQPSQRAPHSEPQPRQESHVPQTAPPQEDSETPAPLAPVYPLPQGVPPSLLRARRHAEAQAIDLSEDESYARWAEAEASRFAGRGESPALRPPTFADMPSTTSPDFRFALRPPPRSPPCSHGSWDGGHGSVHSEPLDDLSSRSRAASGSNAPETSTFPPPSEAWPPPLPQQQPMQSMRLQACAGPCTRSHSETIGAVPRATGTCASVPAFAPPPLPPSLLRARRGRGAGAEDVLPMGNSRESL